MWEIENGTVLEIPAGAKALHVGWQNKRLNLWAQVDPEVPKLKRRVAVVPTGGEVPDGWEFAGTALAPRDRAFHVYIEIV